MNAQQRAESIKEQLITEWPDLYVEIEIADGGLAILKVYGAVKLFGKQHERAEALIGEHDEISLQRIERVTCSRSTPLKLGREVGEPAASTESMVDEDRRGVALMCNNTDNHTPHDWRGYDLLR